MQLFATASPLGATSASDGPAGDARPASDPANADAFQAALNAANQNARGTSSSKQAASNKNQNSTSSSDAQAGSSDLDATAEDETVVTAPDVVAAMLPIVMPVLAPQAAPVQTTPAVSLTPSSGGTAEDGATTPLATAGNTTTGTVQTTAGNGQATTTVGAGMAPATNEDAFRVALQGADEAISTGTATTPATAAAATDGAPVTTTTATAAQATAPQASTAQTTPAASSTAATTTASVPASGTVATSGTDTAPAPTQPVVTTATATQTTPAPVPTVGTAAPTTTTVPATGIGTVDALAQGAAATAQALSQAATADDAANAQATAQATAAANAANTQATNNSPAGTTTPSTSTAPAPTWADLAASFGAQVVATSNGAATRSTTSTAGPAVLADDTQLAVAGSTAQAAGVAGATPVMLPGQAVTAAGAAGAAGQGVSSGSSETVDASTVGSASATRAPGSAELTPEFNVAALGAQNVGQAAAASTVEVDAPTAPPVASQIADGAVLAAKTTGQSVQMILQPEGLGTVTIKISMERGGLAVHLAVDNQSGRDLVQNSWPQLHSALEQRGLTVQSLQLDLSNSGRGNSDQFQAFQQFASQQQGFAGQGGQQGRSSGGDRRGIGSVDGVTDGITETERPQVGAGTASRVDYRI